jgi:hypothetical protein
VELEIATDSKLYKGELFILIDRDDRVSGDKEIKSLVVSSWVRSVHVFTSACCKVLIMTLLIAVQYVTNLFLDYDVQRFPVTKINCVLAFIGSPVERLLEDKSSIESF